MNKLNPVERANQDRSEVYIYREANRACDDASTNFQRIRSKAQSVPSEKPVVEVPLPSVKGWTPQSLPDKMTPKFSILAPVAEKIEPMSVSALSQVVAVPKVVKAKPTPKPQRLFNGKRRIKRSRNWKPTPPIEKN